MSKSNSKKNGAKEVSEKAVKKPVPKEVKKEPTKASASKGVDKESPRESPPASPPSKLIKRWPVGVITALIAALALIIVTIIEKLPIPTPTPPPPITPPNECLIENIGWQEYMVDGLGSTIAVSPVPQTNCEIEVKFDLKKDGWLAVYKKLAPNLLKQTHGIRFSYSGKGSANTLEFKLIERDAEGRETIFFIQACGATSTAEKEISQDIKYSAMPCRNTPGSNCPGRTEPLRPELIDRIDFSFANRPACGDTPGHGEVTIKGIQLIP